MRISHLPLTILTHFSFVWGPSMLLTCILLERKLLLWRHHHPHNDCQWSEEKSKQEQPVWDPQIRRRGSLCDRSNSTNQPTLPTLPTNQLYLPTLPTIPTYQQTNYTATKYTKSWIISILQMLHFFQQATQLFPNNQPYQPTPTNHTGEKRRQCT